MNTMHSFVLVGQSGHSTEFFYGTAAEAHHRFNVLLDERPGLVAVYFYDVGGLVNYWRRTEPSPPSLPSPDVELDHNVPQGFRGSNGISR